MSEYDVLSGDSAREFLTVVDEEKLPIDGHRYRFRMHISRTYSAIYTVLEDESEVRVLEIFAIDDARKRYGSDSMFRSLCRPPLGRSPQYLSLACLLLR